ncbi:MAG: hypothetical protein JW800_06875 [Candidatus Omnitrophica bacterium]|nr:hypothetical protein [Candidatus Omnitrophota bacterium]
MLILEFIICSCVILIAGSKLSLYGDMISERTRFSSGFMGIFFLAIITSLPELVTSRGSISESVNAPDIAFGDLVGAGILNIFYIALLGIVFKKGSLFTGQHKSNIYTGYFTLLLLLITGGAIVMFHFFNLTIEIFNLNIGSILIGLCYLFGLIAIYKHGRRDASEAKKGEMNISLLAGFVISAIAIIACGIWLAHIGKGIAVLYNLKEMSVGLILVAFATTLPEVTVSYTALKRNSHHMAVGNFLGSNFFNLFIIFILDAGFSKGSLFNYVSYNNLIPISVSALITLIAIRAMLRKKKNDGLISWDSTVILSVFIIYIIATFCLMQK